MHTKQVTLAIAGIAIASLKDAMKAAGA